MGAKGTPFVCELCGQTKNRTRATERFCNDCRRDFPNEVKSRYQKTQAQAEKERQAAVAPKPMLEAEKPQFSLTEVALMARRCNMSYGQYVANWKLGKAPEPIKLEKPKKKRGRKCKGT